MPKSNDSVCCEAHHLQPFALYRTIRAKFTYPGRITMFVTAAAFTLLFGTTVFALARSGGLWPAPKFCHSVKSLSERDALITVQNIKLKIEQVRGTLRAKLDEVGQNEGFAQALNPDLLDRDNLAEIHKRFQIEMYKLTEQAMIESGKLSIELDQAEGRLKQITARPTAGPHN